MYIKKCQYGGVDYHDAKERIWQLKWNDHFDVPEDEVRACIFADLMECFPYADGERILAALRGEETYSFPILVMKDGKLNCGEVYDGRWSEQADVFGYKVSESYAFGQVFYETEYRVMDIAKERVCYIPEEQFYAVYKGAPLIERFYHEPFDRYEEAVLFMASIEKHDPKSELVILVHDRLKIVETEWYKENMKVVEELRLHPEKKDVFLIPVKDHLRELKKIGDGAAACKQETGLNNSLGMDLADMDENLFSIVKSHVNVMVGCMEAMIHDKAIFLQEELFEPTDTQGHSYETVARYKDREFEVCLSAISRNSYERQAAVCICRQLVREEIERELES
ncbi:hypothetical protein VSQ48_19915 [Candidatus Ventrimonas sp. KK005]